MTNEQLTGVCLAIIALGIAALWSRRRRRRLFKIAECELVEVRMVAIPADPDAVFGVSPIAGAKDFTETGQLIRDQILSHYMINSPRGLHLTGTFTDVSDDVHARTVAMCRFDSER